MNAFLVCAVGCQLAPSVIMALAGSASPTRSGACDRPGADTTVGTDAVGDHGIVHDTDEGIDVVVVGDVGGYSMMTCGTAYV